MSLINGTCATEPLAPCCKRTKQVYDIYNTPTSTPADLDYPICDSEGYFVPKQISNFGMYCVNRDGNDTIGWLPYEYAYEYDGVMYEVCGTIKSIFWNYKCISVEKKMT